MVRRTLTVDTTAAARTLLFVAETEPLRAGNAVTIHRVITDEEPMEARTE